MKPNLTKSLISKVLITKLRDLGWSQEKLHGLPKICLRSTPISSYFLFAGLQRMKDDHFLVRGGVGMIGRDFERQWASSNAGVPSTSRNLATLTDILNFPILNGPSLVCASRLDEDLTKFCQVLDQVLRSMPRSKSELCAAIQYGAVAGVPWSHFKNHLAVEKFAAFERSILAR